MWLVLIAEFPPAGGIVLCVFSSLLLFFLLFLCFSFLTVNLNGYLTGINSPNAMHLTMSRRFNVLNFVYSDVKVRFRIMRLSLYSYVLLGTGQWI